MRRGTGSPSLLLYSGGVQGRSVDEPIDRIESASRNLRMRIDRLFSLGLPTISFEFFPPRNEGGWAQLYQAIGELHSLKPSYVSVTYGAGGSTRQKTVDLVSRIQNELKIRSMAHLTCVGHTAEEIGGILDQLWDSGIRNVLTLRGDPPAGQLQFVTTP